MLRPPSRTSIIRRRQMRRATSEGVRAAHGVSFLMGGIETLTPPAPSPGRVRGVCTGSSQRKEKQRDKQISLFLSLTDLSHKQQQMLRLISLANFYAIVDCESQLSPAHGAQRRQQAKPGNAATSSEATCIAMCEAERARTDSESKKWKVRRTNSDSKGSAEKPSHQRRQQHGQQQTNHEIDDERRERRDVHGERCVMPRGAASCPNDDS
jgi:hypothetical protein